MTVQNWLARIERLEFAADPASMTDAELEAFIRAGGLDFRDVSDVELDQIIDGDATPEVWAKVRRLEPPE